MGDTFQTVVARRLAENDASAVRARLVEWLIAREIIAPEVSDCILGDGEGHAPGTRHAQVTVAADSFFLTLVTNGVGIESGRIVAVDPQAETVATCESCNATQGDELLMDALSAWYDGDDDAGVTCPQCETHTPVIRLRADPPIACGPLAVTFWNWPALTPSFLEEIGAHLGSEVTLVRGKL